MASSFHERRLERQLKRQERRLERQLKRQERRNMLFGSTPTRENQSSISTTSVRYLEQDGLKRSYLLHKPAVSSDVQLPLVIALHGGKTTADRLRKTSRLNDLADSEKFVVVYPNAHKKNWNDGRTSIGHNANDVSFINSLIDTIILSENVDSSRIYAIGISNGGFMSQRLGCELSNRIAAISVIAGAMPIDLELFCKPSRPMPVIMFSGTLDRFVPWKGGTSSKGRVGTFLSPLSTAKWWATNNNCSIQPRQEDVVSSSSVSKDSTNVIKYLFSGCQDSSSVVLYKIIGGGHTWPSGSSQPRWLVGTTSYKVDASMLSWDFFKQYRR